jgi:hypothetical protein
MKDRVFNECSLSDEELMKKCSDWIDKLCKSGGNAWTLRVPVDFNNDPDMLFCSLIERFSNLRKEIK